MSEAQPKFDLGFLNKISGGDSAFIKEMINTFKEMVPEFIENSNKFLNEKNYEALSREAHKFIPGVSFLGIKYIEQDLILLEEYAKKQENIQEIPKLLTAACEKISEIVDTFNTEFDLE
jgi:HPt (histidine-containing phosphotransfer) domain-containing protein